MQKTEPKIQKDYQIKLLSAISIDKREGATLYFFKLSLKIYLQSRYIKHNGILPTANGIRMQFKQVFISYLRIVLCLGKIFVIQLSLNYLSSCPEYQIKNFHPEIQNYYYKVSLANIQTKKGQRKTNISDLPNIGSYIYI